MAVAAGCLALAVPLAAALARSGRRDGLTRAEPEARTRGNRPGVRETTPADPNGCSVYEGLYASAGGGPLRAFKGVADHGRVGAVGFDQSFPSRFSALFAGSSPAAAAFR